MGNKPWEQMTPKEKRIELYIEQKNTLDLFLSRNAISKSQYVKSLGDLTDKTGMGNILQELKKRK